MNEEEEEEEEEEEDTEENARLYNLCLNENSPICCVAANFAKLYNRAPCT